MADKILNDIIKRLASIEKRLDIIEKRVDNTSGSKPRSSTLRDNKKKVVVIKAGQVTLTQYNNVCTVTGDTYDKRSVIKDVKGWWIPKIKGWAVRLDKYAKLKKSLKKITKTLTEKSIEKDLEGVSNEKISEKIPATKNNDDYGFISDSD